jgi:hypothetical protein
MKQIRKIAVPISRSWSGAWSGAWSGSMPLSRYWSRYWFKSRLGFGSCFWSNR